LVNRRLLRKARKKQVRVCMYTYTELMHAESPPAAPRQPPRRAAAASRAAQALRAPAAIRQPVTYPSLARHLPTP